MITSQEFLDKWDEEIYGRVDYDAEVINSYSLPQATKNFLIEAGLPESAPPFLTFESSATGGGVRLIEKYDSAETSYSKYIYVGFNGNGHPICIHEENGEVIYLDHDNDHQEIFINSSIPQLAESLLAYVDFIAKIKAVNGRSAFLEKKATQELLDWIAARLEEIDSESLTQGSFWDEELSGFKIG